MPAAVAAATTTKNTTAKCNGVFVCSNQRNAVHWSASVESTAAIHAPQLCRSSDNAWCLAACLPLETAPSTNVHSPLSWISFPNVLHVLLHMLLHVPLESSSEAGCCMLQRSTVTIMNVQASTGQLRCQAVKSVSVDNFVAECKADDKH